MMPRPLSALLIVIGAIGLWTLLDRTSSAPLHSRPTAQPAGIPPAIRDRYSSTSDSGPSSRTSTPSNLVVRDQDNAPIAGATLHGYTDSAEGLLPPETPTLAIGGDDGVIRNLPTDSLDLQFLIRAKGFVSTVIDGGWQGDLEVVLRPAGKLTVRVISDIGTPITSARVVLQLRPFGMNSPPEKEGVGDPKHDFPRWVADTDALGCARFERLPQTTYMMRVFHDHYCLAESAEASTTVRVQGHSEQSVVMQDMYGMVFETASEAAIASEHWSVSMSMLDRRLGVLSSLRYCSEQLARRFPKGRVYCHRPKDVESDLQVGYRVTLEDGSIYQAKWPLVPLRLLRDPIFTELDEECRTRPLKFVVLTRDDREVEASLVLGPQEFDPRGDVRVQRIEPGSVTFVEHGRYVVSLEWEIGWLDASPQWNLIVSESEPTGESVTLRILEDVFPVKFDVKWPENVPTTPVHMKVRDDKGHSIMIVNWLPTRGLIQDLMQEGTYTFTIQRGIFERAVHQFEVRKSDRDRVFEIPLKLAREH